MVRRRVRRKQKRGLGPRLFRAARTLLLLTLAGGVLVWAGSIALRPFLMDRHEVAEIQKLKQEILDVKAGNAALGKQIRTLNTPKGIEVEGRRAGLVLPGEIAIQTDGTPTAPARPRPKQDAPSLGAVREGDDLLGRGLDQAAQALGHKPGAPPVKPAGASKHPPTP